MGEVGQVLVVYATAAGSTAGIAERIAEGLRAAGARVRCGPAGDDVEPAGFDAIVVGSAVHDMAWLPPAVEVLNRVAKSGAAVWCFSVAGVQPRGRVTRAIARLELRRLEEQFPAGFTARGHRLFGGIIELAGVPLWGRLFYRAIGGRPGDHRDWPAIDAWAAQIARELAGTPRTTGRPG